MPTTRSSSRVIASLSAKLFGSIGKRFSRTKAPSPILISAPIIRRRRASKDDQDRIEEKQRHTRGPGFQVMSDLHLEQRRPGDSYEEYDIPRVAPYLILVGDIGSFRHEQLLFDFLKRQCDRFDFVMYVPGNHEFYSTSREEGLAIGKRLEQQLGTDKFAFMHQKRCEFESGNAKTVVLGCTLHSQIDDERYLTQDFARIANWTPMRHNEEHAADRAFLERELRAIHGSVQAGDDVRALVATHYPPTYESTSHEHHIGTPFQQCFVSDTLSEARQWTGFGYIDTWCSGHTHHNYLFKDEGLILFSNSPSDEACCRRFDRTATI